MKIELFIRKCAQRFLLYVKLFLGMGLIWTFEIIAGMSNTREGIW